MEKKGQLVFSPSVPQAFQKAFEKAPAFKTDPTVKPNKLLKIFSYKPEQYEDILEAYANAPQVSGKSMINAANDINDIGEIEVIEEPLPSHLEAITRPFRRGDEFFLRRPEQGELIYVGPISQKTSTAVYQPEQLPNNFQQETNPFLNAPADLTKK